MSYKEKTFIAPADKDRSIWRIWSDGSAFSTQNMNTMVKDVALGTGEGFIAGYDTGGLSIWASATPDDYIHYNSGVYYVRSNDQDPKQGAYRIYAPESGSLQLTSFTGTGWSFIYVDNLGYLGEYTGAEWSYDPGKLLIAKVIRDGNNTIENSDIVDMRKFPFRVSDRYVEKNIHYDMSNAFNAGGDVSFTFYYDGDNSYGRYARGSFANVSPDYQTGEIAISINIPISYRKDAFIERIKLFYHMEGGNFNSGECYYYLLQPPTGETEYATPIELANTQFSLLAGYHTLTTNIHQFVDINNGCMLKTRIRIVNQSETFDIFIKGGVVYYKEYI